MSFRNFNEFYSYYLKEHSSIACRKLHFLGTSGVFALMILFFFTGKPVMLALLPVVGHGLAWVGHFGFEKNRPATFRHPLYSLRADFVMFWDILRGRVQAF